MKEIEVKILEINRNEVERKLRVLGAKKVFDGPVDVRMYDTPDRTLKKKGVLLRLRKKGDEGELTVKTHFHRTLRAKMSSEYETRCDFVVMQTVLSALGYVESFRMKKRRVEYTQGHVRFELDKIAGIPWFLEIEAPSEPQLTAWITKLGFTQSDAKNWWWYEVLEYYGHSKRRK